MSVTAIVSLDTQTTPSLPTEAIVTREGKDYIFIRTAGDTHTDDYGHDDHDTHNHSEESLVFERVQVIRGASDLGYTEIQPITPLPDNAVVIVRGAFFVMAMMTETGGHSH